MPIDLDPLSQLIGALSAQAADLSRQITDLRAEVVTNRSYNQTWREEWRKAIDDLHMELRTVKHDHRSAEQASIALDHRLKHIDGRLLEIERVVTIWRTRAAIAASIALAISTFIGFGAPIVMSYFLNGGK